MTQAANSFVSRAEVFFKHLRANGYPNASTLAEELRCSRNTSQRTIYRLRDEYLVPLEYDAGKKGYYLTNPNYQLPQLLPAGKDELTALLLAREIVSSLDAPDVTAAIDKLWNKIVSNSKAASRDLEPLSRVFTSNSSTLGKLSDEGVLQYVEAASSGENVRISYCSPWRGNETKQYQGRVLHVHTIDSKLYLKFWDAVGREIILNASFIQSFEPIGDEIELKPVGDTHVDDWLDGFGVWSGEPVVITEVRIKPPASHYFAKEIWHEDQVDHFDDGEILVRRMPAIVSPELVRRVLSVGSFVAGLEPQELKDAVKQELQEMAKVEY